MGYSTDFSGKLTINPPLQPHMVEEINLFCEERHGGDMDVFPGMPGFWCDWETDGEKLFWNGTEKSYAMDEWLEFLIKKFFNPWGCTLTGKMLAEGERKDDRWTLQVVSNNQVIRENLSMKVFGITE